MQCVLLAAGYATRLYPLTENMPKALLKLGDKTILEMVTDKIDEVSDVENTNIYTVTAQVFAFEMQSLGSVGTSDCIVK